MARIAQARPDVIVSSNPMVFGEELLALPRRCCLNRHSALLPAYGGLWPVFHAFRRGETEVGVSASLMEPGIDKGTPLAQSVTPIEPGDTVWTLYRKTFAASAETMHRALDKVRAGDDAPVKNSREASYFSFPTAEDWGEFRSQNGVFI